LEGFFSSGGKIGSETFDRKLFAEAEEDEKRLGNYFCFMQQFFSSTSYITDNFLACSPSFSFFRFVAKQKL
jgi:hypothetical protein